jgi:uncharacterized protein (DUF2384 family)
VNKKELSTIEESDRLVTLARIKASAKNVFGNAENANRWLDEPLGVLAPSRRSKWPRPNVAHD